MHWLWLLLLCLAVPAQAQTLCFSSPASCPQITAVLFLPEVAPPSLQLPPPRVVLPVYRPVVPLELSPATRQFFVSGSATLAMPASGPGGVAVAPSPAYGRVAPQAGVELAPLPGGSSAGGGVTVNTGFGPH